VILDPDEPLPQARTDRQSLILTERGWAVLGQPTTKAETWLKGALDEMTELFPARSEQEVRRMASCVAADMVDRGAL
jgi:hypothetical protein